jgi:hypothetical protein
MGDYKVKQAQQEILKDCPICLNGRFLNRLSKDGFYCMSCLNEFKIKGKKPYLMEINIENGDAIPKLIS